MYTLVQQEKYIRLMYVLRIAYTRDSAKKYLLENGRKESELKNYATLRAFVLSECGLDMHQAQEIVQQENLKIISTNKILRKFNKDRHIGFGDKVKFFDWYMTQKQECHYCGISENTLSYIWDNRVLNRRPKRGLIEVDRVDPNRGYCPKNCVLACYFCNNDKSNIFTHDQYKLFANPTTRKKYLEDLVRQYQESRK